MKKFLASLGILSLVLALAAPVLAAEDTAVVSATVTPSVVAVSISPTSVEYGILALSTSDTDRSTAESETITATNDGNVTSDFTIMGSDASGMLTTNWTLSSDPPEKGTVAADQFAHRFDEGTTFNGVEAAALDSTAYKPLKAGITDAGTADFVLEMNMPTSSTDSETKSTTVTILATEL